MTLIELRDQLVAYFNKGELRNLCFELDFNYENLPGETLEDKARELITYCQRHGRLASLVQQCRELRPFVSWPDVEQQPQASPGELTQQPIQDRKVEDKWRVELVAKGRRSQSLKIYLNHEMHVIEYKFGILTDQIRVDGQKVAQGWGFPEIYKFELTDGDALYAARVETDSANDKLRLFVSGRLVYSYGDWDEESDDGKG